MKVILIVMDSLGVGEMPDANDFGDTGANTFLHILERKPDLNIPNLQQLGFCNIDGLEASNMAIKKPRGIYGRLSEKSLGKDTTTGHWELAGIETKIPFNTYPNGFPNEFIKEFEANIGRKTIGNYPASGTKIIEELGPKHEESGEVIIYTSADSVLQIAVNVDVIPLEELYSICKKAREMLVGDWACGRVIARPYKLVDGNRKRTPDRKDYSVSPPEATVLDFLVEKGIEVYGIGKISDIFNGVGLSRETHTKSNMAGVDETILRIKESFSGLIFTNLVDFDSEFGHRRDAIGYGKAIEEFDVRLPEIINAMEKEDLLILTADHGNDPTFKGTDHTRERVPAIFVTKALWENPDYSNNIGTRDSFADIAATIAKIFKVRKPPIGREITEVVKVLETVK